MNGNDNAVKEILDHLQAIKKLCIANGLHLFAGSSMQIRKYDKRSREEGALVLAAITMPADGGCGATHEDKDGNERGEP